MRNSTPAETCPDVVYAVHRDQIAAALPGSFARWAAKARKVAR